MAVNTLFDNIENGRLGKNIGISTGMESLDSVLYGIQKKYLYTIGADTSGGKTSFALDVFVYNLLKNRGNQDVSILYYSFEMSADILYAKLLSRHIYDEYGEIITYKDILSLTKIITDSQLEFIYKSRDWLNELQTHITVFDKALSPNAVYATCKEWLKNFGTFINIDEHHEDYIDNDPTRYKISIMDHVGLLSGPGSKKEKIDLIAKYYIHFRNKCSMTGILIQQMNRNSKSMDRKINGYELYQLDDKEQHKESSLFNCVFFNLDFLRIYNFIKIFLLNLWKY